MYRVTSHSSHEHSWPYIYASPLILSCRIFIIHSTEILRKNISSDQLPNTVGWFCVIIMNILHIYDKYKSGTSASAEMKYASTNRRQTLYLPLARVEDCVLLVILWSPLFGGILAVAKSRLLLGGINNESEGISRSRSSHDSSESMITCSNCSISNLSSIDGKLSNKSSEEFPHADLTFLAASSATQQSIDSVVTELVTGISTVVMLVSTRSGCDSNCLSKLLFVVFDPWESANSTSDAVLLSGSSCNWQLLCSLELDSLWESGTEPCRPSIKHILVVELCHKGLLIKDNWWSPPSMFQV